MPKKQEIFSVKLTSPDTVVLDGTFELKDKFYYLAFKSAEKNGVTNEQFFEEALRLGIYGLAEARIAAFLHDAETVLDHGLEKLKLIFKQTDILEKGAAKGPILERKIQEVLDEFIADNGWLDKTSSDGDKVGKIEGRKVGDINVQIQGTPVKVTIESKFDRNVKLGDALNLDYRQNSDPVKDAERTAHGQMLLSLANREAQIALIVFDRATCHKEISDLEYDVTFFPELPGWVVRIGKAENDFDSLKLAYSIAREIALLKLERVSGEHLDLAVKRMLRDLVEMNKLEGLLKKIRDGAEASIQGVVEIKQMISETKQSINRTQEILKQVLSGVAPRAEEWMNFFMEPALETQ